MSEIRDRIAVCLCGMSGLVVPTRRCIELADAVLAELSRDHVVIARNRWERVRDCAESADYYGKRSDGSSAIDALQPGDLEEDELWQQI